MGKRLVLFCKTKSKLKGVAAFLETAPDEEGAGRICWQAHKMEEGLVDLFEC